MTQPAVASVSKVNTTSPWHYAILVKLVFQRAEQLIKWVYEVDPLWCPECGGQMKVVSFIEPPQTDVIKAILKHCG